MRTNTRIMSIVAVVLAVLICVSTSYAISKINLNTASRRRLERLPGVGEEIAELIISYRRAWGHFTSIYELREIPGIGEKRFNLLRNVATVDWRDE